MYTQCPQCQTVFRVTATMLKAARGKVRCGRCAHVFNALTFLIDAYEEPTARSPAEGHAETTPTPLETAPASQVAPQATTPPQALAPAAQPSSPIAQHASAIEKRYDDNTPFEEDEEAAEPVGVELVEEAAEEIILGSESDAGLELVEGASDDPLDEPVLEDAAADEEAGEVPVEELQANAAADDELQIESADGAAEDLPESALEFTASDLSQVFVETPPAAIRHLPAATSGDETAEHEIIDVEMETPAAPEVITLEGESVVVVDGGLEEEAARQQEKIPGTEAPPPRKPKTQEAIDLEVRREIEKAFADDPTTRAEFILPSGRKVSLHRNQDEVEVEEVEAAEALERDTSRQRQTRIAWGIGGVVLVILLGLQVIHYNRQALVQSAQVGPMLTSIYGAFGSELTPAWKVDAYDVRQYGAAADPRSGTVKVRASVTNGAEHAQPYPLLRLTLMNRFGERLRQSDIEPKDYLTQAPGAGQLLEAGQRVDASIAIVDPGDDAVNFEIDVCLRRNAAVTCANDALRQRS